VSGDTLSDLLRAVRLRGALFFYLDGAEPWVAETPPGRDISAAVLPGVEHLMPFHGVARGSCWASILGETPVRLDEGDVVLFPHGDHHIMSSAPGMRAKVVDPRIYFAPRPPQLPFALSIDGQGRTTALLDGGGRNRSVIVCGYLGCDAKPFNPLLASLPRIVRMPGLMGDGGSWIGTFLRSVVEESNRRRQGGEAMLERMSEMMFVEVLRRYVEAMPENQTGWLAGMRDPSIGRALALIHEKPGEAWTVERLGEVAALSRSVLHERFVHFIGQSPIEYLTQWRMQLAAVSLRDTDAKVIEVALEVGYESEAAFSRAFKRAVGESPATWRRTRRVRASSSSTPRTNKMAAP